MLIIIVAGGSCGLGVTKAEDSSFLLPRRVIPKEQSKAEQVVARNLRFGPASSRHGLLVMMSSKDIFSDPNIKRQETNRVVNQPTR